MTATLEKTQRMDYAALILARPFCANVICPAGDSPAWGEFEGIMPADPRLQDLTQNIIDTVDDHKHLRKARILVLVKQSDGDAKKLSDGQRVRIGHAQKASSRFKAMMAALAGPAGAQKKKIKTLTADFILTLSGDYLDRVGALCDGTPLYDCPGVRMAAALIDHELCHCSAVIAGKNVPESQKAPEINGLGDAFLDCSEPDSEGFVFIRYYKMKKDRFYQWKNDVRAMVDVIETMSDEQRTLFDGDAGED